MEDHKRYVGRRRRRVGFMKRTFFTTGAFVIFIRDAIVDDLHIVWREARLFLGSALVTVGLLSFTAGRFCEGSISHYATCTRPSTYYEYTWWSIVCVIIGVWCIALWYVQKRKRK